MTKTLDTNTRRCYNPLHEWDMEQTLQIQTPRERLRDEDSYKNLHGSKGFGDQGRVHSNRVRESGRGNQQSHRREGSYSRKPWCSTGSTDRMSCPRDPRQGAKDPEGQAGPFPYPQPRNARRSQESRQGKGTFRLNTVTRQNTAPSRVLILLLMVLSFLLHK